MELQLTTIKHVRNCFRRVSFFSPIVHYNIAQYHKFYGINKQVFYVRSGRHKQIWWYFDSAGDVLFYSDEICDEMCRVCNNQGASPGELRRNDRLGKVAKVCTHRSPGNKPIKKLPRNLAN